MQYTVFSILEPKPGKIVAEERAHPRLFSVLEPIGRVVDKFLRADMGITLDRLETSVHPQEDYLKVSEKFPIFAVADGVTLEFGPEGIYPVPSGAGEAAKIFCEAVIREVEKRFDTFAENDLPEIFSLVNSEVGAYNASQGRTKGTSNFWDFDLFAATFAFAVLRENTVFWASLCDSYVGYVQNGTLRFQSPVCWPEERRKEFLPQNWEKIDSDERKRIIRREYRNGINDKGELIGYGVVTGEPEAERYVQLGQFEVQNGDTLFLCTDGFEEYLQLPEFVELLTKPIESVSEKLPKFTKIKSHEDGVRFGHERSIIVVSFK